jgi:hypothetical protein
MLKIDTLVASAFKDWLIIRVADSGKGDDQILPGLSTGIG